MQKWEILSSHNFDGVVTSIEFNDSGIAISNNKEIHFIDFQGNKNWSAQMPFKPYQIKSNNGNLFGILMGNGFIVINSESQLLGLAKLDESLKKLQPKIVLNAEG